MKTSRSKRRFWAAVLCIAAVFAMTLGSVGAPKVVSLAADTGVKGTITGLDGNQLEIGQSEDLGIQWENSNSAPGDGPTWSALDNASPKPATKWSSDKPATISVTDTGTVEALKAGEATITASITVDGKTAKATKKITVPEKQVSQLTLQSSLDGNTIAVGQSSALSVTRDGKKVELNECEWESSDVEFVTVNNGTVKGVKTGASVITATLKADKNCTGKITILVDGDKPYITTKQSDIGTWTVGVAKSVQFKSGGGNKNDTKEWSLTEDSKKLLADHGLEFTKDGVLKGTPKKATSGDLFYVTVTAKDKDGIVTGTETKPYSLVISDLKTEVIPDGEENDTKITGLGSDHLDAYVEAIKKAANSQDVTATLYLTVPDPKKLSDGFTKLKKYVLELFGGVEESKMSLHYVDAKLVVRAGDQTKEVNGDAVATLGFYVEMDITDYQEPLLVFHLESDGSIVPFTWATNGADKTYYYNRESKRLYIFSQNYSPFVAAFPTVTTHLVTFNTDGGTAISPVYVEDGKTIKKPTDPKKDGYTFDDWYTDQAKTKKWNSNEGIKENMTLYANWTSKSSTGDTKSGTTTTGSTSGDAQGEGRSVSPPQTNDRVWALWGVIVLIVVLNGAYIALAARKKKER